MHTVIEMYLYFANKLKRKIIVIWYVAGSTDISKPASQGRFFLIMVIKMSAFSHV